MYQRIASLIPRPIRDYFARQLEYVGIEVEEKRFIGFLFSFGLALSAAVAVNIYFLFGEALLTSFFFSFFLFVGVVYIWLNSVSQSKARFVEKILPDALQLIASNIKAGLTTERALLISARPEFGIFSEELKTASKKILSGQRIETVLLDLPKKIKSKVLDRTMWLIVQGIKSGGEIAELLLQLSNDLREENAIKEEIRANVGMYVLLIFFAAAFGAPILFGVSSFIVGILVEQMHGIDISEEQLSQYQGRGPLGKLIGIPKAGVTEEFVTFFAELTLAVTCLFAGLTIGAINTGKELDGIKFVPVMLIIAFIIFFAIKSVLENVFSTLFVLF